jgi:hypothetical protein
MNKWHPLILASPHMTDATVAHLGGREHQVTHLQKELHSFGVAPGKVDGEYGLHTARAVHQAKYRLGYRKRACTETAGERLVGYLADPNSRPALFKARAKVRADERKRREALTPKRVKALHLLGDHLGVSESPPESNQNMFTRWYGMVGPWCAMCGSWAGAMVGLKPFQKGHYYAYCPYVTADAVAGRNGLTVTTDPQPGDVVIYSWGGEGSNPMGDHFGRFITWTNRAAGDFRAREGNTSLENDPSGSQSNGGILTDRDRNTSLVVHFIHAKEIS